MGNLVYKPRTNEISTKIFFNISNFKMATRNTLCQDVCYGYNVFFENCICEKCMEKEEGRNNIFFENQVEAETSLEFKSIGAVENLGPKTFDKISEMETGVSEKTHFTDENQKKEIGKSSKEHVCPSCNKTFSTHKILKRHVKIHSDDKKYQCSEPECNFSFTRKDHLNRHMRAHNGEKPFSCNFCKVSFTTKESKDRHTKNKKACAQ